MPAADWLIPLIALVLTQTIVIAVVLRRTRTLARQLKKALTRRPEQFDDVPTSMLVTALSQLEKRLVRMEASIKRAPSAPAAASGDRSYDLAQRMARQGASAEQITEACGIGQQEAELLLRLHGPQ